MVEDKDSEIRRNLVRKMQRDKEFKLQEQKEFYEDKIAALKSKRRIPPRTLPKRKILSPNELLKLREKGKQEVHEYKNRRFNLSKTGKISQFALANRINRRRLAFGLPPTSQSDNRQFHVLTRRLAALKKRQAPITSQSQPSFVPVGWESSPVVPALEREISQPHGVAWESADVANQIEREVALSNNLAFNSPVNQVEKEVAFFSNLQDIPAINSVSREADFFANILNSTRQVRRPARQRRR